MSAPINVRYIIEANGDPLHCESWRKGWQDSARYHFRKGLAFGAMACLVAALIGLAIRSLT